ncbi:MAG TPA: hypothetical protein VMP01_28660 [Pirellulaceae bacterium]|nr:hypothetical protein [Pirellulaceae bacterium]
MTYLSLLRFPSEAKPVRKQKQPSSPQAIKGVIVGIVGYETKPKHQRPLPL